MHRGQSRALRRSNVPGWEGNVYKNPAMIQYEQEMAANPGRRKRELWTSFAQCAICFPTLHLAAPTMRIPQVGQCTPYIRSSGCGARPAWRLRVRQH
jgi:hypothetical protein